MLPLVALGPAAPAWLADGLGPAILLRFALLALVVLVALWRAPCDAPAHPPGERLAWVGYLVLAVSLSRDVWVDPADFRTLGDLHVTGALVLLGDPRRLTVPAIALSAGWLTTAALPRRGRMRLTRPPVIRGFALCLPLSVPLGAGGRATLQEWWQIMVNAQLRSYLRACLH